MRIAGTGSATFVFLPGFMIAAESYRALLAPVAAAGVTIEVPQLYRRGPAALLGREPVAREAELAADLVRRIAGAGPIYLGGHSRGGQAAWRAAGLLAADDLLSGLVLLDPVDGEGRRPAVPFAAAAPATFTVGCRIIGAELGGRCAPEAVNHEVFAHAAPSAEHVVVLGLGHADALQGRARALGRALCDGGPDPDAARRTCSELILEVVTGASSADRSRQRTQWRR